MIADTEPASSSTSNNNQHHAHGMCQPLAALAGQPIDGIAVGGIGMGALSKLRAGGIDVFRASHETVGQTLAAFAAGTLQRVGDEHACSADHGHHV